MRDHSVCVCVCVCVEEEGGGGRIYNAARRAAYTPISVFSCMCVRLAAGGGGESERGREGTRGVSTPGNALDAVYVSLLLCVQVLLLPRIVLRVENARVCVCIIGIFGFARTGERRHDGLIELCELLLSL